MNAHFEFGKEYPYCAVEGPTGFGVADLRRFPDDHDRIRAGVVPLLPTREAAERQAIQRNLNI